MKFPFYIVSLLALFSAQLTVEKAYASAKQFDIDHERKRAQHIIPKNFRKNPLKHMYTTLPTILGTSVGLEQDLYIRKMFQGNKLYIFESGELNHYSQLGSNWQLALVHTLDIEQKVKEKVWHFKVTVVSDSQGKVYPTPIIYSFRLRKYPYEDMLKLNTEERQELGKQAANHRKVINARPGSLTEGYSRQAATMLEAMETVAPNALPIYGPQLPTISTLDDVTQKISQITIGTPGEREHEKRKKQWKAAKNLSVRMPLPLAVPPTLTTAQDQQEPLDANDNNGNHEEQ